MVRPPWAARPEAASVCSGADADSVEEESGDPDRDPDPLEPDPVLESEVRDPVGTLAEEEDEPVAPDTVEVDPVKSSALEEPLAPDSVGGRASASPPIGVSVLPLAPADAVPEALGTLSGEPTWPVGTAPDTSEVAAPSTGGTI